MIFRRTPSFACFSRNSFCFASSRRFFSISFSLSTTIIGFRFPSLDFFSCDALNHHSNDHCQTRAETNRLYPPPGVAEAGRRLAFGTPGTLTGSYADGAFASITELGRADAGGGSRFDFGTTTGRGVGSGVACTGSPDNF